jgi:PAS domain S-box-containing protein
MSLFIFSTLVISIIFLLVLGAWYNIQGPFLLHVVMLVSAAVAIFSAAIVIAIQPLYFAKKTRSPRELTQDANWSKELASALSSPAAVIDGYVVRFVNTSFLQTIGMVGMSDQIIGMPFTNLIHPADHLSLAELTAEATMGKTRNDPTKLRLVSADGSTLPSNASLTPMRQDGENYLMLFQFTPISAISPLSNDYEAQFNYHSIIDRLEEIVFQLSAEGKILFLNPAWEQLLEYEVHNSLGKSLLDFIHPEDKPMVEARLDSVAQGKRKNCSIEARLLSLRGDPNWIMLRAKTTSTSIEERSGIIGTMTDISSHKEAEAIQLANRRAENTQLNNIPGMIYRCRNDRSWTFEFASDGCIDVTGYAPRELINDPILTFNLIIHQDDRAAVWEYVKYQLTIGEQFKLIYRINTRSGETKLVQEHGRGIFSSTGELLALEGFVTEIPSQRYNVNSTVSLHHS